MDRSSFQYPKIVLGDRVIEWKKSIMHLGMQLDRRLSFGEHLQIETAKAIQSGAALTRLMANTVGPREAKRRLVASVVISKLLYAAPAWTSALNNHAIQKKLFSAQRGVVLRTASAYRIRQLVSQQTNKIQWRCIVRKKVPVEKSILSSTIHLI